METQATGSSSGAPAQPTTTATTVLVKINDGSYIPLKRAGLLTMDLEEFFDVLISKEYLQRSALPGCRVQVVASNEDEEPTADEQQKLQKQELRGVSKLSKFTSDGANKLFVHVTTPPAATAPPTGRGDSSGVVESFTNLVLQSKAAQTRKLNAESARFKELIRTIFLRFFVLMQHAHTPELAMALYEFVSDLPRTSTKVYVQKATGLSINGPAFESKPTLLSAWGPDGDVLLVKVLKVDLDSTAPHAQRKNDLVEEAVFAARFGALSDKYAFISATVEEIDLGYKNALCHCVVMPRMSTTLAMNTAQLPFSVVFEQGRRINEALKYMHLAGIAHLDVKGDNIFVSQPGVWYLGDFGSCKKLNEKITSTTPGYYPCNLRGKAAKSEFDDFMLGFTLLIAVSMLPTNGDPAAAGSDQLSDEPEWKMLYTTDIPALPSRSGIEARLTKLDVQHAELSILIRQLLFSEDHFGKFASAKSNQNAS